MWETEYEDWLLATGSSANTIRQRMTFARRIVRDYGTLAPPPADLARLLARYHGWSRRAYHGHLTSLYEWMLETGQIDRSPLARIRRGPTPQPKARPLSEAELMRALTAATRPHVRTWMLLAALAGLRSHEIAKMHGRDITESFLHVLGKGGRDCSVPTHPVLWEVAQQYPRGGYWFPSPHADREHVHTRLVGLRVAEAFRAAGLPVGSVHRLRATFGTNLMRNGVPTRVIQELMRHASLATTEAYLGVLDADLREAVEGLAA